MKKMRREKVRCRSRHLRKESAIYLLPREISRWTESVLEVSQEGVTTGTNRGYICPEHLGAGSSPGYC